MVKKNCERGKAVIVRLVLSTFQECSSFFSPTNEILVIGEQN